MRLSRFWPALLAALILAGCGTAPTAPTEGDTPLQATPQANATTGSPYKLQAPKRRSDAQIPGDGTLSALGLVVPRSNSAVAPLSAPKDLWERIRRGFAMPDLEHELVRDREQWYASRPEYMERMTARGSKYLFHIVEELERRNMPTELALLPYIESAYNPQAVSSAKAAGIWQFMPATGKSFDLRQNMFRDDRRDVLASTRAALDYLEQLHRMFGDWHLALAAYNWGQGNVGKAVKRNSSTGLSTSYAELKMPDETRYYVPKLQAVKNIVANPARYRTQLPDIGNHPFFDTVTLQRDMDVALIAQLADISEKDFRQLNPAVNKPVVLAGGNTTILLPWDNATLFEQRLAQHSGPLASWTVWTVPRNMSVSQIADRLNVDEGDLRDLNKIPPRMQLKAGSALLVPRQGEQDKDVPSHVADHGQILLAQEKPPAPPPRIAAPAARAAAPVRRSSIRVGKGDSLIGLARENGVSVENLAKWNGLRPSANVKIGQTLALYAPSGKDSSKPTARTDSRDNGKSDKPNKSDAPSRNQKASPSKDNKDNKTGKPDKSSPEGKAKSSQAQPDKSSKNSKSNSGKDDNRAKTSSKDKDNERNKTNGKDKDKDSSDRSTNKKTEPKKDKGQQR